jgi:hypothetical protein
MLNKNWQCIYPRIIRSNAFPRWPLTRKCTFEDVLTILTNIRVRLEEQENNVVTGVPKRTLYSFLLPQENNMDVTDKQLLDLLNETRDVLER